jgi:hypothetical protein
MTQLLMQTKPILMFVAVAILVGTITSMTTSNVYATQTGNSSNSNNNNNISAPTTAKELTRQVAIGTTV